MSEVVLNEVSVLWSLILDSGILELLGLFVLYIISVIVGEVL